MTATMAHRARAFRRQLLLGTACALLAGAAHAQPAPAIFPTNPSAWWPPVDALAGQIPLAVVDLRSSLPQIRAGKLVTPEAFAAYIRAETKKWAKVIQDARIKLD